MIVKEAESYGWIVDDNDATEAYDFAAQYFGNEELNKKIVAAMGNEELAHCLAFIFRMNEFKEWYEYKDRKEDELNESIRRVIRKCLR